MARRRCRVPAIGHVELAQKAGDVTLHRAWAEEEALGDLGIGQALAQQDEDVLLARRRDYVWPARAAPTMAGSPGGDREIDGERMGDRLLDGDAATSGPSSAAAVGSGSGGSGGDP